MMEASVLLVATDRSKQIWLLCDQSTEDKYRTFCTKASSIEILFYKSMPNVSYFDILHLADPKSDTQLGYLTYENNSQLNIFSLVSD